MTRNINAFPEYYNEAHGSDETYPGMDLRDYFAAKALSGLISSPRGTPDGADATYYASMAYIMADAMMAER